MLLNGPEGEKTFITEASVEESRPEVASSRRRRDGARIKARAIERRCF